MSKRAVIGYPSRLSAVASMNSNTANANFPVANLTDKIRVTKPWWSTAAGADWIYGTFSSAATPVQLVTLIGHNMGSSAATMRVRCFSTTTFDNTFSQPVVFDSGSMPVWPDGVTPAPGYRWLRPVLLQEPIQCGAVVIDVNSGDGSSVHVEAIDISGIWDLVGLSPGRQRAFDTRTPVFRLAGGADFVSDLWIPRTFNGGVDMVDVRTTESTGLDFMFNQDVVNPFVFSPDIDNPASWARSCMLVRNQKINPLVGATYRRDKLSLQLIEHQR